MTKLWSRVNSAMRNLFRKRHLESQLDDEIRAYVDMVADERIAAGMSASEARRTALAEFRGIEQVNEAVREQRAGTGIELLWEGRSLWPAPVAPQSRLHIGRGDHAGLGIGATTAIFSAVYSLLLRPLPFYQSRQLMSVTSAWPNAHADTLISPDFVAAQSETKSFAQFAGYFGSIDDNLTGKCPQPGWSVGQPADKCWLAVGSFRRNRTGKSSGQTHP
jgi:putative ABC transport system permease protein